MYVFHLYSFFENLYEYLSLLDLGISLQNFASFNSLVYSQPCERFAQDQGDNSENSDLNPNL